MKPEIDAVARQAEKVDSQLCFSLYETSIAINLAYKPLLDALGLTYP
ncbi:hypothetical protein [Lysobacter sp. P5_B9]